MYSRDNHVDPRALKALLAFDPLAGGRYEPESCGGLSTSDRRHAVEAGTMFSPNVIACDHRTAVDRLLRARDGLGDRTRVTDLFVASFSSARLDYRAGLPAYCLALHFPEHAFEPLDDGPYCRVCGLEEDDNGLARTDRNFERFAAGGVIGSSPLDLAFYLECHGLLAPVAPCERDVTLLSAILDVLQAVPPKESVKKQAVKAIRKIPGFRASAEQAQLVLETLGYCGVLETPEHPGAWRRFLHLGFAPKSSARTDWRYPVDFWRGEFGLNPDALQHWFGPYL